MGFTGSNRGFAGTVGILCCSYSETAPFLLNMLNIWIDGLVGFTGLNRVLLASAFGYRIHFERLEVEHIVCVYTLCLQSVHFFYNQAP